jgi:hypothetical protein
MKKTTLTIKKVCIFMTIILLCASSFAQVPEKMNYQAIVKDISGNLVSNQTIGMQISILQNTATGTAVYIEVQTPTTNANGLFTLEIGTGAVVSGDFTTIDWSNANYFIKTEIDPTGGVSYTNTGTNQLLSVPYALHSKTAENVNNDLVDDADADPTNEIELPTGGTNGQILQTDGSGIYTWVNQGVNSLDASYDNGGSGLGRTIDADTGAVEIIASFLNGNALLLENNNTGTSLVANNTNPANTSASIVANTNSNSNLSSAILGKTTGAAYGVTGEAVSGSNTEAAVFGNNRRNNGGSGVLGIGFNGVTARTGNSSGYAVFAENTDNITPLGNGVGVSGKGFYGVYGEDRYAGNQNGAYGVYANGNMGASGTKTFNIDHPKDPKNKFLRHFSMESNEVLNVYRGTTAFDANGNAMIELPDYFNDINKNISYQLTPVGAYMPLFVKEKVNSENKFEVSGGDPGKEVSWAVYAERNDLYLKKHPEQRAVEIEKRASEKGKYLIPSLYDAKPEKGIFIKPNTGKKK